MSDTLFAQLEGMCRLKRPVILQPGQKTEYFDTATGKMQERTDPMIGTQPIRFEITNITANEAIEAEEMITAAPPVITQEQPSPTRIGTVIAEVGRDYDHPAYLAQLRKEQPMKEAAICLFGCPALRESTPGNTVREKAEALVSRVPGALLGWLSEQINTLAALAAVGEKEVQDFLALGSGGVPSSADTSARSRTAGSGKSSKDSTAPTSSSKSGKRRTTGG